MPQDAMDQNTTFALHQARIASIISSSPQAAAAAAQFASIIIVEY
jgi:hypothetical protein